MTRAEFRLGAPVTIDGITGVIDKFDDRNVTISEGHRLYTVPRSVFLVQVSDSLFDREPTTEEDTGPVQRERSVPSTRIESALLLAGEMNDIAFGRKEGLRFDPNNGTPWADYDDKSLAKMFRRKADELAQPDKADLRERIGRGELSVHQIKRIYGHYRDSDWDITTLIDGRSRLKPDELCGLKKEAADAAWIAMEELIGASEVTQAVIINAIVRRIRAASIPMPERPKIKRFVKRYLATFDLDLKRDGRRQTESREPRSIHELVTTHAGHIVECDEQVLDILCRVLGVQTDSVSVIVGICVHTRAILAVYVTDGAPRSSDYLQFLFQLLTEDVQPIGLPPIVRPGVKPVTENLTLSMDIERPDPVGFPAVPIDSVTVDQGKIFITKQAHLALRYAGIDTIRLPPGAPMRKPHIESFFNFLKERLKELPGFKGRSVADRGSTAKVEAKACLRPDEVRAFILQVCSMYNDRPHEGLGRHPGSTQHLSPNEALAVSAAERGSIDVLMPEAIPFHFLPQKTVKVGRSGFELDNWSFDSPHFDDLRKQKIVVYRLSYRLDRAYFFNPVDRRWRRLTGRLMARGVDTSRTRLAMDQRDAVLDRVPINEMNGSPEHFKALVDLYMVAPTDTPAQIKQRVREVMRAENDRAMLPAIEAYLAASPDDPGAHSEPEDLEVIDFEIGLGLGLE